MTDRARTTVPSDPARVRITDVAPRDGLQNESAPISTQAKVQLVEALRRSGVDEVEVTSFVSPKWVPQLGDAAAVLAGLSDPTPGGPLLSALVPNEKGLDAFLASNERGLLGKASLFAAASETFSRRNTNGSIAEVLERFGPVVGRAKSAGLLIRGYISCVVACPFEGRIAPAAVSEVAARLADLGVDEIDLGDTIGAATPETTVEVVGAVISKLGNAWLHPDRLTLHLHDTRGTAADCVRAALRAGVRSFDGAAGGLGGCPYASVPGRRAPGNIATELLVRTVHEAGLSTGVDEALLASAGELARLVVARAAAAAQKGEAT